jgi:hypothetical protein
VAFLDLTRADHAYLFGFVQCDGHLTESTRNRGRLSVELSIRDVALLERFRELVPYPSSITTRTRTTNFAQGYTSAVWTVYALEARRELITLGLPVGRKSDLVAPPAVPFSRIDYLRGLIDADGSLGFMRPRDIPFVSLTTRSEAFRDFFIDSCPRLIGAPRGRRRNERDGIFNLLAIREAAVLLARVLYYEGCLALPRKMEAARQVKGWVRPPDMRVAAERRVWTPAEDGVVIGNTIADAARLLGRTTQSVNQRRWRLGTAARVRARALALRELRLFYEPL